mgnify:CR=1 FL=1
MTTLQPFAIEQKLIEAFLDPNSVGSRAIAVHSRELTDAGLYTSFSVEAELRQFRAAELPQGPMRGPAIASPQIPDGAGALLWPDASGVHMLEIYTYNDPFPGVLEEFSLQHV